MTEPQRNHKNTEDEIDLRQLFKAIGDFFKNIGEGIVNFIIKFRRSTINYRWLILIFLILGGISGFVYKEISKPIYKSSMLLSSDYFNGRIVDNSIEKLNQLAEEEDPTGLSKALKIDIEVAENIESFETEPFISEEDRVEIEVLKQKLSELDLEEAEINKIIERIEIENKNTFQIIVRVNKSEIIGGLESAIVNYFRGNDYIKNRITNNELRLEERLKQLNKEDKKLDSLKIAMIKAIESLSSSQKKSGSDNLYIGEQYSANPVEIFKQSEAINYQIRFVKEKLYLDSDFEVVDGLTVFKEPESAGLVISIIYGGLIGVGIAYILIILMSVNQYLNRVEKERVA